MPLQQREHPNHDTPRDASPNTCAGIVRVYARPCRHQRRHLTRGSHMGNEYAISRLANDGRPRFYTYSNILWQTAVRTLGDDDLEAVTSEAIGDETLYHVTFAASAVDYLEAVLVTHGAVEVETLPLPDTLLESLGNESELEGAMRRHPAGGSTYTVSPVTFEATLEPCYPCKVNARLALAACLGSFVAACIALAAVLVAS